MTTSTARKVIGAPAETRRFVLPLLAASIAAAAPATATDLQVERFGWRLPNGCTPPRAILALDVRVTGAPPAGATYEVRYRWRKRPGGQWFARTSCPSRTG